MIWTRELLTEGTNAFAASLREEVLDCALGELIDLADRSRGRLCRRHLLTEIRALEARGQISMTEGQDPAEFALGASVTSRGECVARIRQA